VGHGGRRNAPTRSHAPGAASALTGARSHAAMAPGGGERGPPRPPPCRPRRGGAAEIARWLGPLVGALALARRSRQKGGAVVEELEVLRRTRSFLLASGLGGHRVLDLFTDAHPTLLHDPALQPFQRFTLAFEGFAAHPDLAGRLDDGETTFGVEAKGEDDLLRGIAQADLYRAGFHLALFASAGVPSPDLVAIARQRGVGVLA